MLGGDANFNIGGLLNLQTHKVEFDNTNIYSKYDVNSKILAKPMPNGISVVRGGDMTLESGGSTNFTFGLLLIWNFLFT